MAHETMPQMEEGVWVGPRLSPAGRCHMWVGPVHNIRVVRSSGHSWHIALMLRQGLPRVLTAGQGWHEGIPRVIWREMLRYVSDPLV